MKILFLDIDGVMNTQDTWDATKHTFDPEPTQHLKRILQETGAHVVISSAWRHRFPQSDFRGIFRAHGLPPSQLLDYTPFLGSYAPGRRGAEIAQWLEHHASRAVVYAIVDDGDDMGPLLPRLVQTDYKIGLTAAEADRLITMLNE